MWNKCNVKGSLGLTLWILTLLNINPGNSKRFCNGYYEVRHDVMKCLMSGGTRPYQVAAHLIWLFAYKTPSTLSPYGPGELSNCTLEGSFRFSIEFILPRYNTTNFRQKIWKRIGSSYLVLKEKSSIQILDTVAILLTITNRCAKKEVKMQKNLQKCAAGVPAKA